MVPGQTIKMKLKARAVCGTICALIALVALVVLTVQWALQNPMVTDSADQGGLLQHDSDPRLDTLKRTWSEMRGHMPWMRKDLDASEADSQETDNKLLEHMLQDEVFQNKSNVDNFLHMAHLLYEHRNKELGELPQSQQVPSGEQSEAHQQTARFADPIEVKISDQIVKDLQEIVDKMQPEHSLKPKKVGNKLHLYASVDTSKLANWQLFHQQIRQFHLYSEKNGSVVDKVIHDMTYLPLVKMEQFTSRGTQIKLIFHFSNDGTAIFKPMRFPRDHETSPDHFIWSDFERHIAEIASFHLDRVLGFYRVPPAAGRLIGIKKDIKRLADHHLERTIFTSPAGNVCFYGECKYYCDSSHAVCGHPDKLEGYFGAFLPPTNTVDRTRWRHPWKHSYSKRKKAVWENDRHYCDGVRTKSPFNTGRRLLDLMDMAVFDFLQGNLDRHHYETLKPFGDNTFPLHLDNGRAFGKTKQDYIDVLAPIYHCCLVRYSTFKKVLDFHTGTPLSDRMRDSLSKDSLTQYAPILTESRLTALDRRVRIILKTVHACVQDNGGYHKVVVDDGF